MWWPWSAVLIVTSLAGPSEAQENNRSRNPNCSTTPCYNAENLCGTYRQKCFNVVQSATSGPAIWLAVHFEYNMNGSFRRTELGHFDRASCENNDPWLEIVYKGVWRQGGPSTTVLGSSQASIDVSSVWFTLMQTEVCLHKGDLVDERLACWDTHAVLKILCPCNGWDWTIDGMPHQRNIGMFCGPRDQCPLLHDVFLQQTQYFSYNATTHEACLSRMSVDRSVGWVKPRDDACVPKEKPSTCPGGVLSASRPSICTGGALPFHVFLLLLTLPLLSDQPIWKS